MAIGQYVVSKNSLSWLNARATAQAQGGQLASITSQAENDLVTAALQPFFSGASVWIGLSQSPSGPEPAGGWQWESGETFNYTNWGRGEPNNTLGLEDFGELFVSDGAWNDAPGGHESDSRFECIGETSMDLGDRPRLRVLLDYFAFLERITGRVGGWLTRFRKFCFWWFAARSVLGTTSMKSSNGVRKIFPSHRVSRPLFR